MNDGITRTFYIVTPHWENLVRTHCQRQGLGVSFVPKIRIYRGTMEEDNRGAVAAARATAAARRVSTNHTNTSSSNTTSSSDADSDDDSAASIPPEFMDPFCEFRADPTIPLLHFIPGPVYNYDVNLQQVLVSSNPDSWEDAVDPNQK